MNVFPILPTEEAKRKWLEVTNAKPKNQSTLPCTSRASAWVPFITAGIVSRLLCYYLQGKTDKLVNYTQDLDSFYPIIESL